MGAGTGAHGTAGAGPICSWRTRPPKKPIARQAPVGAHVCGPGAERARPSRPVAKRTRARASAAPEREDVFLPHAEEGSLRGCDFGTQVSRRMRPGRRRGPNLVPFMNRSG